MPAYPPDRHLLRGLAFSMIRTPDRSDRVLMPTPRELRSASGAVSLGALAVAVDLAAAGVAMRTIAPDWLATAELEIHAQEREPVELAVAEPTLLRSGRTTAVFEVTVRGYGSEEESRTAEGVALAHSTMTFVRISRPDLTSELEHPSEPTEETRVDFARPDSGLRSPFLTELGLQTTDAAAGIVELPASDFAKNSFGSLQGGITATLAQAACEAATGALLGEPAIATDLSVHYLAQGKGPYRTRCELLREGNGTALHRVEILDVETRTLMATATTTSSLAG
ncbi:MAG: PaaI family thioesterase [Candidatus Binatia bacterium]|nr:PaaI family thioesterase [Candidatus Binatia bacterium]